MVAHYDLAPFGIDMSGLPGLWLQFTIKDRPQPHNTELDATRRFGYHGTSMYCISRIFKQDTLVTGMAHLTIDSKELFGVYYHSAERAHLCQGTYMHYIGFGGGWYVAPLIVLDTVIQCTTSDGSLAPSVAPRSKQKSEAIHHLREPTSLGWDVLALHPCIAGSQDAQEHGDRRGTWLGARTGALRYRDVGEGAGTLPVIEIRASRVLSSGFVPEGGPCSALSSRAARCWCL
jgi:hypothetical protein